MNSPLRKKYSSILVITISIFFLGVHNLRTLHAQYLFVTSYTAGTIAKYDLSGATPVQIGSPFITQGGNPLGIALDGTELYTTNGTLSGGVYPVNKYSAMTGAPINFTTPISSTKRPANITTSAGQLYVTYFWTNHGVSKFNTNGSVINNPLVGNESGDSRASAIDASGNLFVADYAANYIRKFNASTGASIDLTFISTGAGSGPRGIAVAGNYIYVANAINNTIARYDASTGAGGTLVPATAGLSAPCGVAVDGNDLYVTDYNNGRISKFNASNGTIINLNYITVNQPVGVAILPASMFSSTTVNISTLPSKVIQLPDGASPRLQAAATDLMNRLNDMLGTGSFTINPTGYTQAAGPSPGIVLGKSTDLNLTSELPDPTSPVNPKGREFYQISTANNKSYIFLVGSADLGVQDAVYDFLNQLGCRWYFAGSHWTIIPSAPTLTWTTPALIKTRTITMGTQNIAMSIYSDEKPDFKQRYIFANFTTNKPSDAEWLQNFNDLEQWKKAARIYGNEAGGFAGTGFGLICTERYNAIRTWAQDQPSPTPHPWSDENYLASVKPDGTRVHVPIPGYLAQLGVSNVGVEQDLHEVVKDYVAAFFTNIFPAEDCVPMEANDGDHYTWCHCEFCQLIQPLTLDSTTGFHYGQAVNRVIYLANAASTALPPNKYVGYLAYNSHALPPVPGNDPLPPYNAMTFVPSDRSYVFVTLANAMGVPVDELVRQWSLVGPNFGIGVYDYLDVYRWSCNVIGIKSGTGIPGASSSTRLAQKLPLYRNSYRVDAYWGESSNGWGNNGLGHYLAAQTLWKISANVAVLKDDFLTKCFGTAKAPMTDFYNLIDADNSPYLGNDLLRRLYQYLQGAYDLVPGSSSTDVAIKTRIDDLTVWLRYNELWIAFKNSQSIATQQAAMEALLTFVWKIRASNMVDGQAFWKNAKSHICTTFVWPKNTAGQDMDYNLTYAQGNTLKDPAIFSPNDIATMRTQGLNNLLFPENPKSFSTDVVPSCRSAAWRALFAIRSGIGYVYMYTDDNGNLPPLTIYNGQTFKNKGNGTWSLYRTTDRSTPLATGTMAPDWTVSPASTINFANYGKGSYVCVWDDNGAYSRIEWPIGARASYAASKSELILQSSTLQRQYFYVPKGTKNIMMHFGIMGANISFYCDAISASPQVFTQGNSPGKTVTTGGLYTDIVVPVPAGGDDQIWHIGNTSNTTFTTPSLFFFLNVPGYLAHNADELVIPKDAYADLRLANQTAVSAGLNASTRGVVHYYLYTDANGNLPSLSITNGNQQATWQLFKDRDDITVMDPAQPTVPLYRLANGSINANSSNVTPNLNTGSGGHAPAGPGCYHFVYNDNLTTTGSSTITWASTAKAVISSNAPQISGLSEPIPYLTTVNNARRYFWVPKGTTSVQITASTIGACRFYTANGTLKLTQAANNNSPMINIPVGTGQDAQMWTIRSSAWNTKITATNLVFQNTPGYLAVNADQMLVPQWVHRQILGEW